jgi:NAD(P)-dependent dehydrogenase (short-subunit alcohol dehydrogenase family)
MRLVNKTVLITGGNSGISLTTARVFLEEGARVAIIGRNKTKLDAAADTLGTNPPAIQADITDAESLERAVATTVERFGKLDVIFANAGIAIYGFEQAREAIARADTSSNGKVLFTPGTCWRPPES